MLDIKPESQAKAAKELLGKIDDPALRVRIARLFVAQLKKDQEAAAAKALELVMRGNTGSGAMGHVKYIRDLIITEAAILEAVEKKPAAARAG